VNSGPISYPVTMDDCMITFDTPNASLRQAMYGFRQYQRNLLENMGYPQVPDTLFMKTPPRASNGDTTSLSAVSVPSTLASESISQTRPSDASEQGRPSSWRMFSPRLWHTHNSSAALAGFSGTQTAIQSHRLDPA
jgi:hypothetical protein